MYRRCRLRKTDTIPKWQFPHRDYQPNHTAEDHQLNEPTPDNILSFTPPPKEELVEIPEDILHELRQASFRTGIPEKELLEECLRIFANYHKEHGHIPFAVVEPTATKEPTE